MATPIGVLIALFLSEYAGPRAATRPVQLVLDVMNGLPSIIVAVFIYALLIEGGDGKQQSGFAGLDRAGDHRGPADRPRHPGGAAPRPRRTSAKPPTRSASPAGAACCSIILPAALPGIVTATLLSVARAAGETAPVLLLSSLAKGDTFQLNPLHEVPNVPVRIFQLSEEANPEGFTEAWGLSLILIVIILALGLGSRYLLNRSKRKLTR